MTAPRIITADGFDEIAPDAWNALAGAQHPFVSHAYLHALEASRSANAATGWQPLHQLAFRDGNLNGALPLYRKFHSYGEFVFDFAWAEACARAGLRYYPKLLTAVPFTPVSGPRLLGDDADALIDAGIEQMRRDQCLSWHVLFPQESEISRWQARGFMRRMSTRFVWSDRGYGDFDGFLAALRQKRRKEIRRERRQVADAGVTFRAITGDALDHALLAAIYRCYVRTYELRGQSPYLTPDFFTRLARTLSSALVIFAGEKDGEIIAAAICLRDAQALCGRWWGTLADLPGLHFEACYYQGITFCLAHGLKRYDPGVQGEHKLLRGFAPEATWSLHRVHHPGLSSAIGDALTRETAMLEAYIDECRQHLPFRSGD